MKVVWLAHRPDIAECVKTQREKTPDAHGQLVMRWTVQTDGTTKDVTCLSEGLCSMYLESCLKGLIQSWTFPAHSIQGRPIDIPFSF